MTAVFNTLNNYHFQLIVDVYNEKKAAVYSSYLRLFSG